MARLALAVAAALLVLLAGCSEPKPAPGGSGPPAGTTGSTVTQPTATESTAQAAAQEGPLTMERIESAVDALLERERGR